MKSAPRRKPSRTRGKPAREMLAKAFRAVFACAAVLLVMTGWTAESAHAAKASQKTSAQKAPVQKASSQKTSSQKSSPKTAAKTQAKAKPAPKNAASASKAAKPASKTSTKTSLEADRASLQKEQAQLQKELDSLKSALSKTAASHQETSSALARSEVEISRINARLRELDARRARIEKRLRELKDEERAVTGQMTGAESEMREIARAQYVNVLRNPWHSLVGGRNPHETEREKAALLYFLNAESTHFSALSARKSSILSISQETKSQQKVLEGVLKGQKENRTKLLNVQEERRHSLESLAKRMSAQKADIERIEKDQARLEALSRRIEKAIADRERAARQKALAQAGKSSGATAGYAPPSDSAFSKKKGSLVMPALGRITGRFGENRENLSGVSTKWKGILIEARQGSDVLACEEGTVIFSDWVQGWGNTMYIDHGSGFLSVYAYNESLYKSVGEKVRKGETVASVGNTGGSIGRVSALYFELRHASIPLNPLQWIEH